MWREIPGFEGLYAVSMNGEVKSLRRVIARKNGSPQTIRERILRAHNHDGYRRVVLSVAGIGHSELVHRLVAMAWIENTNPTFDLVNHKDGNRANNHYGNLEWCDGSYNQAHAYRIGLRVPVCGEDSHMSKIKACDATQIVSLRNDGLTYVEISRRTGIRKHIVESICCQKAWLRQSQGIKRFKAHGERHGRSKLTSQNVAEIVTKCREGMTHKEVGDAYGVSRATVGAIMTGKLWSNITGIARVTNRKTGRPPRKKSTHCFESSENV